MWMWSAYAGDAIPEPTARSLYHVRRCIWCHTNQIPGRTFNGDPPLCQAFGHRQDFIQNILWTLACARAQTSLSAKSRAHDKSWQSSIRSIPSIPCPNCRGSQSQGWSPWRSSAARWCDLELRSQSILSGEPKNEDHPGCQSGCQWFSKSYDIPGVGFIGMCNIVQPPAKAPSMSSGAFLLNGTFSLGCWKGCGYPRFCLTLEVQLCKWMFIPLGKQQHDSSQDLSHGW